MAVHPSNKAWNGSEISERAKKWLSIDKFDVQNNFVRADWPELKQK